MSTSGDSRWTVYIAMNLWRHGTTNLDNYPSVLRANDYYVLQCVDAAGRVQDGPRESCMGHWYSRFPIGGTVLATPLIAAVVAALRLLQPILSHLHSPHAGVEAFLRGDFDGGHPLIEHEVASLLVAVSAVLMYLIARLWLPMGRAVFLAALFALATSAYSIAARALWQHTPSVLLITLAIYLLLLAENRPTLAIWAAIPIALSYTVRPTDGLFVLALTAYVALRHRRMLPGYLLAAAPIAAVFLAYNFSIYHTLLSPYYRSTVDGYLPRNWRFWREALAGNLISPSRGLLVFTPLFALSIWSMLRGKWKTPLAPWLAAVALLHWLAVSAYVEIWWAGHSYGPRFFTDLTPVLVLFLIPYLERWTDFSLGFRSAFVVLALTGLAIHVHAGWSPDVFRWNVDPDNIDQHPGRVWDWHDPQFLR